MSDITAFLQRWAAAELSGDTVTLDAVLTDDFVGVGPLGFMLPKSAWLARHQPGELNYKSFDLDEVQTRACGDAAVAIVRQIAKGAYRGHPIPEAARATLLLVSDNGGWQLAGVHLSFIAGTAGAPPAPGA